jgi:hypothetical protein
MLTIKPQPSNPEVNKPRRRRRLLWRRSPKPKLSPSPDFPVDFEYAILKLQERKLPEVAAQIGREVVLSRCVGKKDNEYYYDVVVNLKTKD